MAIPDPPPPPAGTESTGDAQRTDYYLLCPLPLYVWSEYTVNARGSILATVRCARCRHTYAYEMVRSEPGGGWEEARARATAELALRGALEKGFDPVPCPECGTYQPNMLPQLQDQHRGELRAAGLLLLVIVGIWFVVDTLVANWLGLDAPDWLKWMVLATAVPAGLGLIAVRWYLGSRYDPNSQPDVELRKAIGRQRSAGLETSPTARWDADNRQSVTRDIQDIRFEPGAAPDLPPRTEK
jgi:hypothetical protein